MQDATNIKQYTFYIDGQPTLATEVWITEFGEVYVSLRHPKGGDMNVNAKNIRRYIKESDENKEL